MKLAVYIDGLNLYYGVLKKTPYKWLDVESLVKNILPSHCSIVNIKYFTARISPVIGNIDAPLRQSVYIRALKILKNIEIYQSGLNFSGFHNMKIIRNIDRIVT